MHTSFYPGWKQPSYSRRYHSWNHQPMARPPPPPAKQATLKGGANQKYPTRKNDSLCVLSRYVCWAIMRVQLLCVLSPYVCWALMCVEPVCVLRPYVCWALMCVEPLCLLIPYVSWALMCVEPLCVLSPNVSWALMCFEPLTFWNDLLSLHHLQYYYLILLFILSNIILGACWDQFGIVLGSF